MSKRKLTRRQAWRIEKIQQERQLRALRKAVDTDADTGQPLGPEQQGRVIANYGASVDVSTAGGAGIRCRLRQNLELLVPGDDVVWQALDGEDSGVITALLPRSSLLARPDAFGNPHPLVANLEQILIVTAPLPHYSTDLVDHYLVAAESSGITPLLVFNKTDLIFNEVEKQAIEEDLQRYRDIGYPVFHTSSTTGEGMDILLTRLQGKTSAFVGQSGVGKSSLISALCPDEEIRIGTLSGHSGLGRHTTSTTRYHVLPGGGAIIDSPGVREFSLWHMKADELIQGFIEFRPLLGQCRFRNCSHRHEPGCALLQAVREGKISAERLDSYQRLLSSEIR